MVRLKIWREEKTNLVISAFGVLLLLISFPLRDAIGSDMLSDFCRVLGFTLMGLVSLIRLMKGKVSRRMLMSSTVLMLIYTIYYCAIRITGSMFSFVDFIVCGIVGLFCSCAIVWYAVNVFVEKKRVDDE